MAYAFAGMRDYAGTLTFRPRRAPEEAARLRLCLTHRGVPFTVEVSADEARYTLQDGESLTIQHEDEKIVLTKDSPLAVRPVTKVKRASIPGANP
jgi:trehalose/maltose hydrolase-like predicted phosphorylase